MTTLAQKLPSMILITTRKTPYTDRGEPVSQVLVNSKPAQLFVAYDRFDKSWGLLTMGDHQTAEGEPTFDLIDYANTKGTLMMIVQHITEAALRALSIVPIG